MRLLRLLRLLLRLQPRLNKLHVIRVQLNADKGKPHLFRCHAFAARSCKGDEDVSICRRLLAGTEEFLTESERLLRGVIYPLVHSRPTRERRNLNDVARKGAAGMGRIGGRLIAF